MKHWSSGAANLVVHRWWKPIPLWGVPSAVVNAVAACSLMQHFDAMRRGVIDFYDITYYLGVMVFMLAAAHVVTDNRKAS